MINAYTEIKRHKLLLLILSIFGSLYVLISFVNHYLFRTYALDLGLYTNALYKYAHFTMADNFMIKEQYESILGGHFDLYLLLFSPAVYLFGTYTLLVLQVIFVLVGGIGVYKYFTFRENGNQRIAYLASTYFLLFFGVFSAFSFDYHSVVVASSLIPWFFLHFAAKKYIKSSLLLIFLLVSQENTALFVAFIVLGLMIQYRKNRVALSFLSAYFVVSLLYFITAITVLIPSFSSASSYTGFRYPLLGTTPLEAISTILHHPLDALKLLFVNHHYTNPFDDYIKAESHLFLLCSGMFVLLRKPYYLIMLIPIYGQKFFHDSSSMWGIGGQYSIEFAPILAIGIFSILADLKNNSLKYGLITLVMLGTLGTTIRLMDNTVQFINKGNIRLYEKSHYTRHYDVAAVYHQLDLIPPTAIISAQSPFVPHLALRDFIYQFPIVKDAEYIILSTKENPYPMSETSFSEEIKRLIESNVWKQVFKNDHLMILKRRNAIESH